MVESRAGEGEADDGCELRGGSAGRHRLMIDRFVSWLVKEKKGERGRECEEFDI